MIRYVMGPVVVTDSKLFGIGGPVRRWADRVETAFTAHAIAEAPTGASSGRINKSSANAAHPVGSLKAGISGSVSRVGPRQLQTIVESSAPYTLFVLRGTGPVIFSKSARIPAGEAGAGQFTPIGPGQGGMYIPANPGWGKSMLRQRVRGQSGNNFLGRAYTKTSRTHPSLRGHGIVG